MFRVKRVFTVSAFTLLFSYVTLMVTSKTVLTVFLVSAAAACLFFTIRKQFFAKHMLIISACIVFALLLFDINLFVADYTQKFCGNEKTLHGTVYSSTAESDSIILDDNTVNGTRVFGKIRVYTDSASALQTGDRISLSATELFRTDSDGFFRFHSLSERTFLTAFADDTTISVNSSEKTITGKIFRIRESLKEKFYGGLSPKTASIACALITGDKDGFSDQFSNDLKYSGASHIFAVSGMHLSLWTGLFFIFFKQRSKTKLLPNIAAIAFVVFYIILTGFSPSVLRAGIMLISVFAAKLIKRQADSLNSLGLSGTLLLLFNPFLAGNVSFLLSFTATFALIFFSDYVVPVYHPKNSFRGRIIRSILSSFTISLCVILTTIPVTSLFFGYTSLLSPISSIILTPVAEIVMITCGIAAILPTGSFLSGFIFLCTNFFSQIIIHICEFFGEIDIVIQPTPAEFILPWYLISLFLTISVFLRYKNKEKTLLCILLCVISLLSVTAVSNTISKNVTEIYIPENDNGTMISVAHPAAHKSAIFGTGGSFSAASQTVSFLNGRGILQTDCLIIPRDTRTENCNTDYITKKLEPENTIEIYKTYNSAKSTHTLWKNAVISSEISDASAISVLEINEIKIVICTLPSSDFSSENSSCSHGDILITRSSIPETVETDNFNTIIIMTDRKYTDLPENAYSTADGRIKILLKGDSYVIHR